MEKVNFIPFQPIAGVPVVQIGDRFLLARKPSEEGCDEVKTVV